VVHIVWEETAMSGTSEWLLDMDEWFLRIKHVGRGGGVLPDI
jgi:hypothetical protein